MTPKPRTPRGQGGDGGDGTGRKPPGEGGDGEESTPSTKFKGGDAAKDVGAAQDKIEEYATLGTPGGANGKPAKPGEPGSTTPSGHTKPSLEPNPDATPGGTPTNTDVGSPKQREGHRIENDSATILRRAGYDIKQNTGEKGVNGTSDPDYNMEGKLWDCYAPSSDKVDNVRGELRDKVKKQSGSIVINMERSPMTVDEMKALLPRVKGLEEAKIIDKDGNIIDAFPQ